MAYPRSSELVGTSFWDTYASALPERQILELFRDPTDPEIEAQLIEDEACPIGGSGLMKLDHIVAGNPMSADVFALRTAVEGGGTLLTPTMSEEALSSGEVRVHPGSKRFEVDPATYAGTTLYATYLTEETGGDGALLGVLWAAIRGIQRQYIRTRVFGATIDPRKVCAVSPADGKIYVADPTDVANTWKRGTCWTVSGASVGTSGEVATLGKFSIGRIVPTGVDLFVGRNGGITYYGDESAEGLGPKDYRRMVGWSDDGSTINFGMVTDQGRNL